MKLIGDFTLCHFVVFKQSITTADDLVFFWCQDILHRRKKKSYILTGRIFFYDIHRRTLDNIQQTDLISLFVCSDRFIKRNFT